MLAPLVNCVMLSQPLPSLRPRPEGSFSWATHYRGPHIGQLSNCNFFLLSLIRKLCIFFYLVTCLNQQEGLVSWIWPADQRMLSWKPMAGWTTASATGNQEQNGCPGILNPPDNSVLSLPLVQRMWSQRYSEPPGNGESDKWGLEVENRPTHLPPCPAAADPCCHTGSQATELAPERLRLLQSPGTGLKAPGEKAGIA